ncbi:cupin domain-containing protein [Leucobacter sp. W1153]|uniref:cupin domain-containing protein n=1 Tax=Leucobacter sp. W1153 TaxID=3439064 RepID=UPI003F317824
MAHISHISSVTDAQKAIEPLQQPMADPLGAEIETKTFNLFSTENGNLHAGTWETATGLSRWSFDEGGEVIYVLGGKMTVTRDGEEPQEIEAGDLAVFPEGWTGTWNVTEPLSKVYVVYK